MDDLGVGVAIGLLFGIPQLLPARVKLKQHPLPKDGPVQKGNREQKPQVSVGDRRRADEGQRHCHDGPCSTFHAQLHGTNLLLPEPLHRFDIRPAISLV